MTNTYKIILSFILVVICQQILAQTYVDLSATGANDGTSWENAYTDLSDALANTANGEIWVAQGTYTPGGNTPDTTSTFTINVPLNLYGGFNGTESNVEERDPEANLTILSGDTARDDIIGNFTLNRTDNVHHVLHVNSGTSVNQTVIDGFTISGGHTCRYGDCDSFFRRGGGIFADGAVLIEACLFTQNFGNGGSSIYLNESNASNSEILSCTFTQNLATNQCAGIFTRFVNNVVIEDCLFDANTTNRGCVYTNNSSNVVVEDCEFTGNGGDGWGNGFYNWQSSEIQLIDCDFIGNQSLNGGAIYYDGRDLNSFNPNDLIIEGCTFSQNTTTSTTSGNGGAIFVFRGSLTINECDFSNHNIVGSGGHCFFTGDDKVVNILNSTFKDATIGGWGGAHTNYGENSTYNIENCVYEGNMNTELGGAVNCGFRSISTFKDCLFESNSSNFGGAVSSQNDSTEVNIINCEFNTNVAANNGGAISASTGSNKWTVEESIFIANSANFGGAIHFNESGDDDIATFKLSNSQIIFNSATTQAGGMNIVDGDTDIENTIFFSNFSTDAGVGGAISTNANSNNDVKVNITNSTFLANSGAFAAGIAQFMETDTGSLVLTLQNNIFQNDGDNYVIEGGMPSVVSNGGNFDANNTMMEELTNSLDIFDGDAQLMDPDDFDFSLTAGSPCIDAGVTDGAPLLDINGNVRGDVVDIGAVEFNTVVSDTEVIRNEGALKVFPNPVSDQLNISLENNWKGDLQLQIYTLDGRLVYANNLEKNAAQLTEQMNVQFLASGQYYVTITDGQFQIVTAMSKL